MNKNYIIEYFSLPYGHCATAKSLYVEEEDLGKVLALDKSSQVIRVNNVGWHKIYRVLKLVNNEEHVYYHQPLKEVFDNNIHTSKELTRLIKETVPKIKFID